MISVVLYGRNDSYGYNLHKRAALSLNCIAEVLDAADDEILFVDYNTPDDFPTFPEAIQDTLTPKAKRLLRVLRVRPRDHARFADRSHLVALEPVARNVAVRRSNPANRWILSTNTDMIFVPRGARSLSAAVAALPDSYYHLPRFELPESLWESLDRLDAAGTIAQIGEWGREWHLNEIVLCDIPAIRYDGPGDFQLILRQDLFDMHGFDERMLLGWHVDSNIAMRLALRHPILGELVDDLFGYHCDHTRQVTPAHRPGSVQNDWRTFVTDVTDGRAPNQPEWGLADVAVEEVRLSEARSPYVRALAAAIPAGQITAIETFSGARTYNITDYDPAHVAPFLIDSLCCYPADTRLGWFGRRPELLGMVAVAWSTLGFTRPIAVEDGGGFVDGTCRTARTDILHEADVLVFDFRGADPASSSLADDSAAQVVLQAFRLAYTAERERMLSGLKPRRFIAVNAINNEFEAVVTRVVGAALAPFSTRLRQGFVIPARQLPAEGLDLMPTLRIGEAGSRQDGGIDIGGNGVVFFGPYLEIPAGSYRMRLAVSASAAAGMTGRLAVDIVTGEVQFATHTIALTGSVEMDLVFTIEPGLVAARGPLAVEFRAFSQQASGGRITGVSLHAASPAPVQSGVRDLLPMLRQGRAVRWDAPRLTLAAHRRGDVFFGPFIPLAAGRYRVSVSLRGGPGLLAWGLVGRDCLLLEAVCGAVVAAQRRLTARAASIGPLTLEFDVPPAEGAAAAPTWQIRLAKSVGVDGRVEAVSLERIADLAPA